MANIIVLVCKSWTEPGKDSLAKGRDDHVDAQDQNSESSPAYEEESKDE